MSKIFSGNIFLFYAFDIGEDIYLEDIEKLHALVKVPSNQPKYFKDYHVPLSVELPHPHDTSMWFSCKLHSFGAITITYKVPFSESLEDLKKNVGDLEKKFQEQSISDLGIIFKKIKSFIKQAKFFHLKTNYTLIQTDSEKDLGPEKLQERYGSHIASILRFERQSLSEYQKNEILESSLGYYRGDLIVIDTEAAFVYDPDYEEILDLFEFATMQQLELRYFDKTLNQQLNLIYEKKIRPLTFKSYLPFIGSHNDEVLDLGRLKVDISVIVERLQSSIKLVDEMYYFDIYKLLEEKLDIKNLQASVDKKLEIIKDIRAIYGNQVDVTREDMMTVLIIILIFIELVVGILSYLK